MYKLIKTIFFSAVILLPQLTLADTIESGEPTHEEAISMIMDLSGLNTQVPQISEAITTAFNANDGRMADIPSEIRAKLSQIIELSFDENTMIETIKGEIAQKVSLDESKEVLKWYLSDLGKSITRVEEKQKSVEEYALMMEQKEELLSNKSRVAIVEKIVKITLGTETQLDIQAGVIRAIASMGKPSKERKEKLEKYLAEMKEKAEPSVRKMLVLAYSGTYREVEEEDLKKYIDFLSKSTTQTLINSGNTGISKAILDGTEKMMQEVAKLSKSIPLPKEG